MNLPNWTPNWIKNLLGMTTLKGDGTWPFTARIDGDDIVVDGPVTATSFGGAYDPQDDGETASGTSTKAPSVEGCALPVIAACKSTAGSPLAFTAHIPWRTPINVTIHGTTVSGIPLIDNGPAKSASEPGMPHAIDLTPAVAARFNPNIPPHKLADQFEEMCSFRIVGGAKYASIRKL